MTETALQSFKKIWAEEFSEDIPDEEAMELGSKLLSLFDHIYRPVKKKWLDAVSDDEEVVVKNKT